MPSGPDDPTRPPPAEQTPTTWVDGAPVEPSGTTDVTRRPWSPEGLSEARSLLELALGDLAPEEGVLARERYELRALLGRGGMGEVRIAHDQHLRRDIALKTLRIPDPDHRLVARFLQEAQITGQLEHPGIVPVHDVGVDEAGTPYFTMQRVEGRSLAERIADDELGSLVDRLDIFKKVCDAVAFAHSKGVVHSDLKPSNIMVGSFGEVMVLDWGIAKIVGDPDASYISEPMVTADTGDDELTRHDAILGTPSYMSPEQARGERDALDPRSDIYSLGAVLYAMLTGTPPYLQKDARIRLRAVASGQLEAPRSRDPSVPRELDAVIRHAMQLFPRDRYRSALALRDDLQAYLEGRPVSVLRYSSPTRALKWLWRHRRVAGPIVFTVVLAMLVLVASAAVGGTTFVLRVTEARDRALAAEQIAQQRYAEGLVTQAVLQAESGHAPEALLAVEEAQELYDELGLDPVRADVIRSYVHLLRPPPLVSWTHPGAHAVRTLLRPDGRMLLARDTEGVVRLHELPSTRVIAEHAGPAGRVTVAMGYHGEVPVFLFSGDAGLTAIDVRDGRTLVTLPAPDEPKYQPRVTPSGFVVSGARSGVVVYDAAGTEVGRVAHLGGLRGVSDDGRLALGYPVVGSEARQATDYEVVDLRSSETLSKLEGDLGNSWLSPSGRWVVADQGDAVVGIDPTTGREKWRTEVPAGWAVLFDAEDRYAVLSSLDGWARWLRLEDGTLLHARRTDGRIASVARDGELVSVDSDAGWSLWLAASPSPWLQVDDGGITSAVVSKDHELLLTGGWSGNVRLWNWRTGTMLLDVQHTPDGVRGVALLEDGRRAVSAGRDGTVVLWDLVSGERLSTWSTDEDLGLAMAAVPLPGSAEVVAVYETGQVRVWDLDEGQVSRSVELAPLTAVWDAQLSPDGTEVLVSGRGDHDPGAVAFDPVTGTVREVVSTRGPSYQVSWRPDGEQVALATHAGSVLVHTVDGAPVHQLDTLRETLSVGFSRDGRFVASGNYAGELQVWKASTGEQLLQAGLHDVPIGRLLWAGQTVLTFDGRGRAHRFELAPPRSPPTDDGSMRLALARDALERQDWERAVRLLQRAEADGAAVPAVERARALAGLEDVGGAEAAMAAAVAAGELAAGSAEVWSAALTR